MAPSTKYRSLIVGMLLVMMVALASPAVAAGGNGTIMGTVYAPSGEVLDKAEITVVDLNLKAITDMSGSYILGSIPAGEYTLVCSYVGFQDSTAQVTVAAGQTVEQNFVFSFGAEIEVRGAPLLVGQAKALNKQKNAVNITNVVSSAQMGEFPDKNAAEATQRIPGLSLYRDMGEGRYVIVRGTEPRLNSTTVNGERLPSPEKDRRNVALDTIPADLLEAIEVSKVLTPDMDGDAIGGTVDLVTQRAPEEVKVSASLGLVYADQSEDVGYNGTAGWGQRFFDNKFGILLSGSAYELQRETHNFEPKYDDGWLKELQLRAYETNRERYGFTGDFDWKASDRSSYYLRTLYTNYRDDEIRRRKRNRLDKERLERDLKDRLQVSDIYSFTFGGENMIGRSLVLDYHLARNTSKEETANQIISSFKQKDIIFDPNVSPDYIDPNNIRANPLNEDIAEYKFNEIEGEYKVAEEKDWVGALNFTQGFYRDAGFSGLWKAGAKVRLKTKDQNVDVSIGELDDDLYLSDVLDTWTPTSSFFGGRYDIGPFQDPTDMRDLWNSGLLDVESVLEEDLADFSTTEDTYAAYGMGEFIFGARTTLVGGVRMEHTTTSYDAWELAFDENGDPEALLPVSSSNDYTEWLPAQLRGPRPVPSHQLRGPGNRDGKHRPQGDDCVERRLDVRALHGAVGHLLGRSFLQGPHRQRLPLHHRSGNRRRGVAGHAAAERGRRQPVGRRVRLPEPVHEPQGLLGRFRHLRQLHLHRLGDHLPRPRHQVPAAGAVGKHRQLLPPVREVRVYRKAVVQLHRQVHPRGRRRPGGGSLGRRPLPDRFHGSPADFEAVRHLPRDHQPQRRAVHGLRGCLRPHPSAGALRVVGNARGAVQPVAA